MILRGLLVVAFVVGVTLVAPTTTASASPCAFSPASVAVVVDFGDGSPVSAVCVPADSSDNGAAVLAARARQLGTPAPRFDSSGFVCGIDGFPSSGCGEQTGGTYAYWSYWHGSGSWDYSNVGPGGSRVHGDVVEGWRFQPQGAGNPSDPPPNGSADHNATCAPATTTTTTLMTDAPQPATNAIVAPDPTTDTTAPTLTSASSSTSTSTTTTTTTTMTTTTTSASTSSQVAAPVRVTEKGSSGSSPWPALGAGAVIVGLIGAGVFAARRRAGAPP